MKEKLFSFIKSYIKAFMPAKNYLKQENTGVSEAVNKKLAEVNCRRISRESYIRLVIQYVSTKVFMSWMLKYLLNGG